MKIYIAGGLFTEVARSRNRKVAAFIESLGYTTYLPQRDAGVFSLLAKKEKNKEVLRRKIFTLDTEALYSSRVVVCLLDKRKQDEGMCVELGIARTLGKICVGYSTAPIHKQLLNIMVEGSLEHVFTNEKKFKKFLRECAR